ncbi:MAG: FAD-dependent oxidoreductase [Cyanobium sp.]
MSETAPKALIIGGGIAGMASAIALGRGGWSCTLLEQDPQRARPGQGLLLPPGGCRALERLGVRPIEGFSAAIERYELCQADGRLDQQFAIPGARSLLHQDLLQALQEALPAGTRLEVGGCLALAAVAGGGWEVISNSLPNRHADLIVAADGVGSVCRRQLFPTAQLTPERTTEVVLVTRAAALVQQLRGSCRKYQDRRGGLALGLLPCSNDQLVVFAQFASARHSPSAGPEAAALLRRCFGGWNPLLDQLLKGLDTSNSRLWRTTYLEPLPRLHDANLVLVGDSGHPLLTVTSQGASAAMEDALVLAESLATLPTTGLAGLASGLDRYSRARLPLLVELVREGRARQQQFLDTSSKCGPASAPLVGFGTEPILTT